jgi:hypothetical protein
VSLEQHFAERRRLIETQQRFELAALSADAAAESEPAKKLAAEDRLFAAREAHKRELIKLTWEQQRAEQALAEQQAQAARLVEDLRLRAAQLDAGAGLDTQFQTELAEMQARHAEEIARLRELAAEKSAIDEAYRLQKMERDRLMYDQERRLREAQLANAAEIASGMSSIFENLYELTGRKQKEFFYLAKAAALAEAIVNTAQAVTKALAQGGIMGPAMAAVVAAAGGVQIATIAAQQLASGGPVRGFSPHAKADNIPIWATAGEFMQPVSAVQYYGRHVMEAIRRRMIPRNLFAGISLPRAAAGMSFALAEGGSVPLRAAGSERPVAISFSTNIHVAQGSGGAGADPEAGRRLAQQIGDELDARQRKTISDELRPGGRIYTAINGSRR